MAKDTYYMCPTNSKHRFRSKTVIVDGVEHKNLAVCSRCAAVYNFGGINVNGANRDGVNISPFLVKDLTHIFQHSRFLDKVDKMQPVIDIEFAKECVQAKQEELKKPVKQSIWRMRH